MKVMCELCVEELANVKDDTPRIRNHADSHDESPSSLIRPTIIIRVVIYIIISAGITLAGWRKQSIILAATGSIILFAVLVAELFFHEREQQRIGSNKLPILENKTTRMKNEVLLPIVAEEKVSEFSSLIHSDSLVGSGSDSDFADNSIILTEGYLRKLKYDSLQKYVKDW